MYFNTSLPLKQGETWIRKWEIIYCEKKKVMMDLGDENEATERQMKVSLSYGSWRVGVSGNSPGQIN